MAAGLHGGRDALRAAAHAYGAAGSTSGEARPSSRWRARCCGSRPRTRWRPRAGPAPLPANGDAVWGLRADAVVLAAEVELGRQGPSLLSRAEQVARELEDHGLTWPAESMRLYGALVAGPGGVAPIRRCTRRLGSRAGVRSSRREWAAVVRDGRWRGSTQARVAATARCAGRVGRRGARASLDRLRVGARAPLAVRLLDRDVRAELAAAGGRRGRALRHLRAGLADLHEWQSSFGSLDLQTNVVGHGQASRRPRARARGRLAATRGALRVVRARADAGQPGAAGAGAPGRVDGGRPGRAARDGPGT